MSMASVQLVGTNRDALLLSFKDAKVRVTTLQLLPAKVKLWRVSKDSVFVFLPALSCGVWSRHAWSQDSVAALFRGAGVESVYCVYEDVLNCGCAEVCVLIALCCVFGWFQEGFVQNLHIPMVRVDPENRCAVMLVYGTCLVVLPFRKDMLTDEQEGIVGEGYEQYFLNICWHFKGLHYHWIFWGW